MDEEKVRQRRHWTSDEGIIDDSSLGWFRSKVTQRMSA